MFKQDQLTQAVQIIRLDEIETKELYFEEENANEISEALFFRKYKDYKENYIDITNQKPKGRQQQGALRQQAEESTYPDSQSKLISMLYPGLVVDDMTSQILAQVTMVYMEELIEASKCQSLKEGANKIKADHVREVLRQYDLRNENKHQRQFSDLFD